MKIALVHDYLREYGGAERVVETLHEMWPEAPLYTSFVDWDSFAQAPEGKLRLFKSWDIRTSWVQNNWFVKKLHSPLRFLAPKIWASFDLSSYDVVLSSSGWYMCRGVALDNGLDAKSQKPVHICYIHHPPRNLYGYPTGSSLQKYWPVRVYAAVVNFFLRQYDYRSAQAVDYFIANSEETAKRVEKFYRRESVVIYPPVEVAQSWALQRQGPALKKREYFLSVGRLTYSKRVDIAIFACNRLKLPLKIIGSGKEEAYLRSIAGPTIEFAGGVSDRELDDLYSEARALIFCALDEDFGMVPVEAMAHGTPVVALAQGGVKETVVDGVTGVLFAEPTVESLVRALERLEGLPVFTKASAEKVEQVCRKQAEKFSKTRFKRQLIEFVDKVTSSKE